LLTLQLESGGDKKILFKLEDIRKDQIVTNLILLMDNILKKEEGMDLDIVTYRCVPTSPIDGLIEIVPNSETLFHIANVGYHLRLANLI
jgi:phosphatidylinositol kinase/protein kinase (PI-3  family)